MRSDDQERWTRRCARRTDGADLDGRTSIGVRPGGPRQSGLQDLTCSRDRRHRLFDRRKAARGVSERSGDDQSNRAVQSRWPWRRHRYRIGALILFRDEGVGGRRCLFSKVRDGRLGQGAHDEQGKGQERDAAPERHYAQEPNVPAHLVFCPGVKGRRRTDRCTSSDNGNDDPGQRRRQVLHRDLSLQPNGKIRALGVLQMDRSC